MVRARPVGSITRGTSNPNRLRRVDRWLADVQGWRLRRSRTPPVIVDLGYGASPVTAVELHDRLRRVRPDVEVVGLEIDRERVRAALPSPVLASGSRLAGSRCRSRRAPEPRWYGPSTSCASTPRTRSRPRGQPSSIAFARQGILIDWTCNEIGRLATWVTVDVDGPQSLTLSWRLRGLERPSDIAERLPKALIHRNVPREPVHEVLQRLDDAWRRSAPYASFDARQWFVTMASTLREEGLGMLGGQTGGAWAS